MKKFKSVVASVLLFAFISGIALEAPYIHRKFIRNIAEESVVQIFGQEGTGTGSHVRLEDGRIVILTNKHICQMTGPLMVKTADMKLLVERKIISISDRHDLCAIEALPDREGIELGSNPTIGDELYTLGHPRGEELNVSKGEYFDDKLIQMGEELNKEGTCTEGKAVTEQSFFGAVTFCVYERNTIEVSSPTYGGNSGSPIVNKYGRLVGVIFAGNPSIENMGFGVPLLYVEEFLGSL